MYLVALPFWSVTSLTFSERIVGIVGFAAVRIGDNSNLVFAVVLIRSFVAFRVSDGELVAVRIIGGSSLTAEFVIAFCRASQRVIHRAGLAAVCVNLLYSASQQVIDILCRIAFGVGNTKLIARKVIGVRGNAAERVCFGQQPSYLVVSVGGFVAFASICFTAALRHCTRSWFHCRLRPL